MIIKNFIYNILYLKLIIKLMAENVDRVGTKKTPLEMAAYIEQINMRERKYSAINKVFTLNVKKRNIL
jgi:hypothetical protein